MLTIFSLLKRVLEVVNSGLLRGAEIANIQVGPTIPQNTTTILKIERKSVSIDGIFGTITINGTLVCESIENLSHCISEGMYDGIIDMSPRLGYLCPHLKVHDRDVMAGGDAGIRIHIANEPKQLEGCVATGTQKDGNAVNNSRQAFQKMMALLPPTFKVLVYSVH